ncbi:SRPBCC family protein [Arthrobacter castelli]|uniref:SRPBCC family protein n=1 Tax=Arthrobacter castelli TaxID=271431 RepID=UPI0003FC2405|nr:SRPBCC family protein [Arthrobacter castelli]
MGNANLNKELGRYGLGAVEQIDDERTALNFERSYPHPVQDVWAALTTAEGTIAWLAQSDASLKVGGHFDLRWLNVADADRQWWNGRILQIEPPRLLVYTNSAHGLLRWELDADDGGRRCRLKFSNVVNAVGETALMSAAGWHAHLDHLREALDGKVMDWPHWWHDFYPAWEAIHAEYIKTKA